MLKRDAGRFELTERGRTVLIVVLVLLLLLLAGMWWLAHRADERALDAEREKRAVAEEKLEAQEQARSAEDVLADLKVYCDGSGLVARELRRGGYCGKVERQIKDPVDPEGLSTRQKVEVAELTREVLAANPRLTREQVVAVVADYFRRNPPRDGRDGTTPGRDAIREAVVEVYRADPPADGTDGTDGTDGADGVDGSDGEDGADGRGVTGATITDAGELVVSYSDGTSQNLGRVVGAQGPAGPQGERGATGQPGTATPGTYDCGAGQYVQGFTIGQDGSVQLVCQPVPIPPGNSGDNGNGPQ